MNAPEDFTADDDRLMERITRIQLQSQNGRIRADDLVDLEREMSRFKARWGDRLRESERAENLHQCIAMLRRSLAQDEIAYRTVALAALAWRREIFTLETMFAAERGLFGEMDTMPPVERRQLEELLGPRERALGATYHAIEDAEQQFDARVRQLRHEWPERAEDFARRMRNADEPTLTTWIAEAQVELNEFKAKSATSGDISA